VVDLPRLAEELGRSTTLLSARRVGGSTTVYGNASTLVDRRGAIGVLVHMLRVAVS
jgi:hypothetical protein